MTDLKDTLTALSEAATQGEWLTQATDTDGPDYGVGIVAGNLGGLVGAALPWPTEIDSGDFSRVEANAAFIVALVNAYRSGQLVPVPSVEMVAALFKRHHRDSCYPEAADFEAEHFANALLAAMKGEGRGDG